jgi:hypothetical protein
VLRETIGLKDMLSHLDSGQPFQSLEFVTLNKAKDTGGEWIKLEGARKHQTFSKPSTTIHQPSTVVHKNPQHYSNSTRNILLPNGEIRKVHIRLIRRFNGKTVI